MTRDERSVAVLFADVAGSTRLYETLGNAQALVAVGRCLELVKVVCEGHGGRLIKTIGDEAMTVFASADDCTEAAAEIQGKLALLPAAGGARLAMRVGYHYGPAIEADGDVFGDSVNVAARMVALAKGGQVITSGETVAAVAPWLRERLREVDSLTVKGKSQEIGIFELLWQESADDLTALSTRPRSAPTRLRLAYGAREFEVADGQSTVTLGRDPASDVVVTDKMASRMHARVERRRDRFVIVDQSSNGTYVTVEGEGEVLLRREELLLRGRGHVTFGHANAAGTGEVLRFQCLDAAAPGA
ncbi:MAG: adenylate/guanylate cyclase domain-containing protein [Betaproteobacteria bacterium]